MQTTRKGRTFRRLLLLNPGFRLCFDDKQHSTGANARAQVDSQDAGSEFAQSTSAPIEAATRLTHQSNGDSTSRMSRQFRWMSKDAPAFRVRGDDIDVLPSPSAFYDTLKEEVGQAKRRIVLSSLYFGTGKLEQQLVNELYAAQRENPDLQISILLDYTRGSRGSENSRTMLLPLLRDHGSRARVSLYHTPELRGLRKWLLPSKFNETIGVQHIKVYLFDDNLVLSGANLSDSYFTNRQDRYMILRDCGPLADYCEQLVTSVASASFQLQPDNSVKMEDDMQHHPYKGKDNGEAYKNEFRSRVAPVIDPNNWTCSGFKEQTGTQQTSSTGSEDHQKATGTGSDCATGSEGHNKTTGTGSNSRNKADAKQSKSSQSDSILTNNPKSNTKNTSHHGDRTIDNDSGSHDNHCDTWVYPLIQMNQFGIRVDEEVTQRLWRDASEHSQIFLASGYLNLPSHYEKSILCESSAIFNILTAHPTTNGFLGAAGPAGSIPSVYTLVTRQFYQQVRDLVQRHRVHVTEYQRAGWTFHGKGLWYYPPEETRPSLTFIGSPNFGYRSVYRDIEAQFALVTENPRLRNQLQKEQEILYRRGYEVTKRTFEEPDRYVPPWVRWFTHFCRSFF